jgi:hypothetical protein
MKWTQQRCTSPFTSTPAAPAHAGARDLAIEYRDIGALIPHARNARTHSPAQVAEIAGSIREFGFINPVLIDPEGGIIAGHGRVLAARQLEMAEIPTICLSGLSETQRRAYILADNNFEQHSRSCERGFGRAWTAGSAARPFLPLKHDSKADFRRPLRGHPSADDCGAIRRARHILPGSSRRRGRRTA